MSAVRPRCEWTGTSSQVVDGGRCPECREKVSWSRSSTLSAGGEIRTVEEFNRRAARAVNGIVFLPASWDKRFARDMRDRIQAGQTLSEKQQSCLFSLVHRYRRQITDHGLKEYAAAHAKGHDQ